MARIETPREGFTGRGVAGLQFEDGRAETDDPAVIAYARRHGYTVTDDAPPAKKPAGRPPSKK
ncbi:hypothetical protein [Streptomyces shenzhenensis]|uniref:Uncharacterized protein n=1 Tax=Streptomyces shenzhenensis TaxID=943815 RepID=A0A3M0I5V1_9ACTN|nr:hypothetical protein [Streptomyces shenzhenensis]RMB83652.1 hypothetical protein CTZ28_23325 [Streptomyces shenzhenensis]